VIAGIAITTDAGPATRKIGHFAGEAHQFLAIDSVWFERSIHV